MKKGILIVLCVGIALITAVINFVVAIVQGNIHSCIGWLNAVVIYLAAFIFLLVALITPVSLDEDLKPTKKTMKFKGKKKD